MYKTKVVVLFIALSAFALPSYSQPTQVEARSGCCSHHGGVVGCVCGDGTPLSHTCAPYYPECSDGGQNIAPALKPGSTPKISIVPTPKPSPTLKLTPSTKPSPRFSPSPTPSLVVEEQITETLTAAPSAAPSQTLFPNNLTPETAPAPVQEKNHSDGLWKWFKHLLGWK